MSGGYFDYNDYHLNDISDKLQSLIDENDSTEINDYGLCNGRGYSQQTLQQFQIALHAVRTASVYLHRIDWLVSGDDGEETFMESLQSDIETNGLDNK